MFRLFPLVQLPVDFLQQEVGGLILDFPKVNDQVARAGQGKGPGKIGYALPLV